MPPSTSSTDPLQKDGVAARRRTRPRPRRPRAVADPPGGRQEPAGRRRPTSARPATCVAIPGAVSPGQTALTRMPSLPGLHAEHLSEHDQRALRDRVRADRRLGPDAGVGGDRDDRASAGCAQVGQAGERVAVGRDEVRLQDRVPGLVGRLGQRRLRAARPRSGRAASSPPSLATASSTPSASTSSASVASAWTKTPPVSLRDRAAPRSSAPGEDDRGALGAQPLDDRLADAGGPSRDERANVPRGGPSRGDYPTLRTPPASPASAETPCKSSDSRYRLALSSERPASYGGRRMEASGARAEATGGLTGSTELARNALGLPAILFCIVTGSAPLAAMMFNDPLSGYGMGIAVPAGFWIATVAFTLFSVAYVEMARRVTTAGGIYSYMSYGFGRVVGLGTAVGITAAYILFTAGVNGVTSYFAQTSILDLSGGFDMDWRIYAYCFIALMFLITYFHVEIGREDPRHLPDRRADHPHDLLVRRRRAGRRPGRDRLAGAQPGGRSSAGARASRAPHACSASASPASASSPASGRGSASRWRRTTPRRRATRRR